MAQIPEIVKLLLGNQFHVFHVLFFSQIDGI